MFLLIELYLVLNIAVAELSHKEDFCFSSGNVSFSFLMFTWKPVIWNHSVLQVLGNRWKWRILSSPIEFNPTLVWLSYFKWSLIILLLRKFNGNYMKENKRLFFFILFLWTRWLPLQNQYFQEMQSLSTEFKSNLESMYFFFCKNSHLHKQPTT